MLDPSSELYASSSPTMLEVAWFRAQGVTETALYSPLRLGTDHVVFADHGRFEFGRLVPRRLAVRAIILPGFDRQNRLVDLIAWNLKTGMLATWLGKARALGDEGGDEDSREPQVVHANPLQWLRAGRSGIVLVDDGALQARPAQG